MSGKPETYECALCHGIFEKAVPDAEALEETRRLFGEHALKTPLEVVCDDCFKKMMADG
jgi:hypothetical protein